MLNPFFLQGSQSEQGLVQDLINEQLRMYGVETYYIPRKYLTKNTVIKEVIQSEFTDAYPLEAYVDSYEGYGGQGTVLSKFGIENLDDLTLIISQDRYSNYITPLIENLPNIELATRPKEGDLIYFPLGDRLFEIKYVEHEQPFYQLRKNYVYTLRCSLFRYEDEVLDTGIAEIDDEIEQLGYIQTLTLIGAGTTATGITTYCASGGVNRVYITNMGNNYNRQPIIGFSSAPAGGVTAVGIASLTSEYIGCGGGDSGKIEAINIINPGCGYTVAPWITIQARDSGVGAAATAGISTGVIGIVTVTSGGSGYTTNPAIRFSTGSGISSATGYGQINSAGIVTAAYITFAGAGYTFAPTVTFDSPTGIGTGLGVGSFVFNEIVTGQTSGTTARVKKWTASSNELEVSIVDGSFTKGETIVGQDSGAKYALSVQNTDDLVSGFADNDNIETEADAIIDFSEGNPFGMP